jgi:type VI secretion system secreted protein Hcp
LKIDGIAGESTDDKHKEWIDVLSFSWGGSSRARPSQNDFQIVKLVDKASPLLVTASCKGTSPGQAMFVARKAGGGKEQLEYLKIKFSDILISSFHTAGSTSDVPMETLSLNFTKLEFLVAPQTEKGTLGDFVPGVCEPKRGGHDGS